MNVPVHFYRRFICRWSNSYIIYRYTRYSTCLHKKWISMSILLEFNNKVGSSYSLRQLSSWRRHDSQGTRGMVPQEQRWAPIIASSEHWRANDTSFESFDSAAHDPKLHVVIHDPDIRRRRPSITDPMGYDEAKTAHPPSTRNSFGETRLNGAMYCPKRPKYYS